MKFGQIDNIVTILKLLKIDVLKSSRYVHNLARNMARSESTASEVGFVWD